MGEESVDQDHFHRLYSTYSQELDTVLSLFDLFDLADFDSFAAYVFEYTEDYMFDVRNIRILSLALDFVLATIRKDVREETGIDILERSGYSVRIIEDGTSVRYANGGQLRSVLTTSILPTLSEGTTKERVRTLLDYI
jgi:hypothetical protein